VEAAERPEGLGSGRPTPWGESQSQLFGEPPKGYASAVKYLMLPEDEADMTEYLCGELGLVLLLSDRTTNGQPAVAKDPLKALIPELPLYPRRLEPRGVYYYLFWCPLEGPIRTLGEAPEPTDAVGRVGLLLTKDAAGGEWGDIIDHERTPLLTYRRCSLHDNGDLIPGALGSMPVPVKATLPGVRRLHGRAERWLRRSGERVNPFDYCDDPGFPRPDDPARWWVWARPHALERLRAGGAIWMKFGY